jgi:hypothetical protein
MHGETIKKLAFFLLYSPSRQITEQHFKLGLKSPFFFLFYVVQRPNVGLGRLIV